MRLTLIATLGALAHAGEQSPANFVKPVPHKPTAPDDALPRVLQWYCNADHAGEEICTQGIQTRNGRDGSPEEHAATKARLARNAPALKSAQEAFCAGSPPAKAPCRTPHAPRACVLCRQPRAPGPP